MVPMRIRAPAATDRARPTGGSQRIRSCSENLAHFVPLLPAITHGAVVLRWILGVLLQPTLIAAKEIANPERLHV